MRLERSTWCRCVRLLAVAWAASAACAAPTCEEVDEAPPSGTLLGALASAVLPRWARMLLSEGVAPPPSAELARSPTVDATPPPATDSPPPPPADSPPPPRAASQPPSPSVAAEGPAPSAPPLDDVSWTPLRAQAPAVSVAEPVRQRRVRAAMEHVWKGYRTHAWGLDELDPTRSVGIRSYGMGLTLVDSLDTLLLMGMEAEAAEAIEWIEHRLRFGEQEEINVFEVTIRVLGGLLAAYEHTGNFALLDKADEIGNHLLFAFHTPHGLPYGTVGLKSKNRYNPKWSRGASTIAEVATLQLEFRALSRHTSKPSYEAVAQRIMDHLRAMAAKGDPAWPTDLPKGLYPMFISPESGQFTSHDITLGARADSLYEYLLKQWIFSGRTDTRMRAMYDEAVAAIRQHLVRRGGGTRCGNCTFVASWNYRTRTHVDVMDHLACFVPGMLALGAHGDSYEDDMQLARELMSTCYQMYAHSPSGLAPEIAEFSDAHKVRAAGAARHSLLRPETVESLFVMWRMTGEAQYREWGWHIFEAIEQHARVKGGGFSPVKDVTSATLTLDGTMESFFPAETLKYLYLLFGAGTQVPLDEFVFNTEAHALRIHPEYQWGARWGSLPGLAELDTGSNKRNASGGAAAAEAHEHLRAQAQARAALLASLPASVSAAR